MAEKCPNCGKAYQSGEEVCPSCGLVFPFTTDTLVPGTLLQNRYEIGEMSHVGGMGYVYLGRDKKLYGRSCIVKQVKEPVRSEAEREKLEEEARRMAKLSHPNVAIILDHFVENGYYFLVVELIYGKTLNEVFEEHHGRLNEEEVVKWAIAMCDVVEYIHGEGIVHRDISPDNIMVTNAGNIKFVDFGTLRELRHINSKGTAGMGKFGYAPPEQWQGQPERRSDIFALGATIYYLLSGSLPLSKEYASGQGPKKTDFTPEFLPIRFKNPQISPQLEAVLQIALQLDVNIRYSSAAEMGRALSELGKPGIPIEQATGITKDIPDRKPATMDKPIDPVPTKSGSRKWNLFLSLVVTGLAIVISIIIIINPAKNANENTTPLEQGLTETTGPVLEPGEKKPLWQFDYRANDGYASEPIVVDNKLFFIADGVIYCLDAMNGNLVRKYNAPLDRNSSNPPNQYNNYKILGIYVGRLVVAYYCEIYCIDIEKGNTLWYRNYGEHPVLDGDKLFCYVVSSYYREGSLISIDVTTGKTMWEKHIWDTYKFREIKFDHDLYVADISVDNYRVYFMYYDSYHNPTLNSSNIGMACLDKNSGQLLWKNSSNVTGSNGAISTMKVSVYKIIEAVCFYDGMHYQVLFICLSPTTGEELWRTAKYDWNHRSMAIYDWNRRNMAMAKSKIIECHDGGIACLDVDSGNIIWTYSYNTASAFLLDDMVIVSNAGKNESYELDLISGEITRQYGVLLYSPFAAYNRIIDNNGKSICCYDLN